MDYGAIIPIAAFIVAVQVASKTKVHPLFPASVATVLPYIANLATSYIRAVGYNLPILPNLFTLASVLTFLVQFTLSLFIFQKIRDDDDITTTVLWTIGGAVLVVFAIPLIISWLIHF